MKTQSLHNQLVEWRHDLHMHPQISFEEEYAAAKVSTLLKDFGIEVIEEFGKTGVVGIIQGKENKGQEKSIAIRADMDALPMTEKTNLPYSSKNEGVMHSCGHDGHSTMLLGAAKYLSETKNFFGKVFLSAIRA